MARLLQVPSELSPLVISNARPSGRVLGLGAYGREEELEIDGLVCAGKTMHSVLLDPSEPSSLKVVERFYKECSLHSTLRHPNIVQFLGISATPSTSLPFLVTEKMPYNLHDLLENHPNIHLSVKQSVVKDIARGLLYLHRKKPSIVHRDLSARNISLDSGLRGKISDFGVATTIDGQHRSRELTPIPGATLYMPPEAYFTDYSSKLDIFSFGVVVLFTVTNIFPFDLLSATYTDENQTLQARSELERRHQYVEAAEKVNNSLCVLKSTFFPSLLCSISTHTCIHTTTIPIVS